MSVVGNSLVAMRVDVSSSLLLSTLLFNFDINHEQSKRTARRTPRSLSNRAARCRSDVDIICRQNENSTLYLLSNFQSDKSAGGSGISKSSSLLSARCAVGITTDGMLLRGFGNDASNSVAPLCSSNSSTAACVAVDKDALLTVMRILSANNGGDAVLGAPIDIAIALAIAVFVDGVVVVIVDNCSCTPPTAAEYRR